jgi:hypothetical protein
MGKKHEDIVSATLFYAFVDFGKSLNDQPVCHLVPSAVVADVIGRAHKAWLATPGKKGQQRKDSELRRFLPNYDRMGIKIGCGRGWLDRYRENWDALVERADT